MTINPDLHERLDRLVGTWRTDGRMVAGEHAGASWTGFDVYEWFPGAQQLVHRVDVELPDGRHEAIEFLTPDPGSPEAFAQTSFDSHGAIAHSRGSFDADDRYRVDAGDTRATLTFESPLRLRATWERRLDGEWHEWMQLTFARIADAHIEVRTKTDHTR